MVGKRVGEFTCRRKGKKKDHGKWQEEAMKKERGGGREKSRGGTGRKKGRKKDHGKWQEEGMKKERGE